MAIKPCSFYDGSIYCILFLCFNCYLQLDNIMPISCSSAFYSFANTHWIVEHYVDPLGLLSCSRHTLYLGWGNYYQNLLSKSTSSAFDENHEQQVVEQIAELTTAMDSSDTPAILFRVEDVSTVCSSLKLGKAAGWDEIYAESLRHGGYVLHKTLCMLYNSINAYEYVPRHFRRSVIIPIPKGQHKSKTEKDNYRGISLLSVIAKLYEKLLIPHFEASNMTTNDLQGACKEGCSSLHTAFLLRETISYLLEQGSTPYVALLDTRKAFDSVWHNGLFLKLHQKGCNPIVWKILRAYYTNFNSRVFSSAGYSDWFPIQQGVFQGAPFSMLLFTFFNTDLLDELSSEGVTIGGMKLGCPSYADDIAIVSIYKRSLQRLLDVAYEHSRRWRYTFNCSKSFIVPVGSDVEPSIVLRLGSEPIPVVDSAQHLGLPLSSTKNRLKKDVISKVDTSKYSFYGHNASLSLGSIKAPLPPTIMNKLYWSITVPRMLYGFELLSLDPATLEHVEKVHLTMARKVQSLPPQTAGVAALAPLG